VPDVVRDQVNGFSAAVDDAPALSEAIVSLASDPGRARRIGELARATAGHHSWTSSLAPLGDIYQRYLRPVTSAPSQNGWMQHPELLTGPAHAADVISNGWDDLRRTPRGAPATLRTMIYGLEGVSFPDLLRGAALLKGLTFRPPLNSAIQN
jgi:hypothetical protein